jgi:hypothetical protein
MREHVQRASARRLAAVLWIAAALLLSATGCKHVRTAGFDRNENTVKTCGGWTAELGDLREEADHHCPVAFLVGCDGEVIGYGASSDQHAPVYGEPTRIGMVRFKPVRGACCIFRCK